MKKAPAKKRPTRRAAKKAKRPPVTVQLRDGWRQGEALTIAEAREAAAALAERLQRRFSALLEPLKKGGKRGPQHRSAPSGSAKKK